MRRTVADWVDYIQTLHAREIELTLERVQQVYQRLLDDELGFKVISVAGTNGKGSSAAMLAAIYQAAGYRVGKYTSPHLKDFNERIEIQGQAISDVELLSSFVAVEKARDKTPITYFEFATLTAIEAFERANIDIAIMEVGLGGRLDAVNILDADVAIVTNISIDHTAWLGNTVEEIAVEKAGIARPGKPCVIGMIDPPTTLLTSCAEIGAACHRHGLAYQIIEQPSQSWNLITPERGLHDLPLPFGQSGMQLQNAAAVVYACLLLNPVLPVSEAQLRDGLTQARIYGRCQLVQEKPAIVVDVAHNVASVARLHDFLMQHSISGRVIAVCGMLKDKQIELSLEHIHKLVDVWHLGSINNPRGASSQQLAATLAQLGADTASLHAYESPLVAFEAAKATLTVDDLLVVFGSFFVAGDILRVLESSDHSDR
ncbi:bifunctional folylpolyglutamate synthase/dihydrofolate synthase [Arenicella chitinivorans]|uniref:Dihydrofolate synthase/folylpolyglutamate synthase n=1 Tax=Arenicella chitinivorans TaxID=1329800 RepID=A0A918RL68_9GAMM|nr:bifunctional tetrahydrofolate synthase/dihydrofolate synthase [Arenicella chitinivorans]GHA00748.1 bifunctional folylpolyglutamate synthase/dihydrofolate synthase [Arenicella chitinivorans]